MRLTKFLSLVIVGLSLFACYSAIDSTADPERYLEGEYIERVEPQLVQNIYQKKLRPQEISSLLDEVDQQEIDIEKVVNLSKEKRNEYVMDYWSELDIQEKRIRFRLDILNHQEKITTKNKCRLYSTLLPAFRYLDKDDLKKIGTLQRKVEAHLRSDFGWKTEFDVCSYLSPFFIELIEYDRQFDLLDEEERAYVAQIRIEQIKDRINTIEDNMAEFKEKGKEERAHSLYKSIKRRKKKLKKAKKYRKKALR